MACYRLNRSGIVLSVRLTPHGGRDAIEGMAKLADGREVLKARVRAVPDKGAANAALVALLARHLGTSRSAISIVGGGTVRLKELHIAGDRAQLAATVETWRR